MLFEVSKEPAPEVAQKLANSKLMNQWEHISRLYFNYFENRKEAYLKTIDNLLASPFTRYRLFSNWFNHYQKVAYLSHQQLIGDITDCELKEANKGLETGGEPLVLSNRAPAQLRLKKREGGTAIGASFVIAIYAFFILKFNKLWLGLPLATATLVRLTQDYKQPYQRMINAYKYIAEKRAASVWYDLKQAEINTKLAKGQGMDTLKKHLETQKVGLIELEKEVAGLVEKELSKKK